MPSPDTTPYADMRIYDKDPQDVYETAVVDLMSVLPDWKPRESNTEVLLLEALALQVAESVFAINRLPDGVVEVLLRLFGVVRDSGSPPTAQLRFNMVNTAGYTIPAGSLARLSLPGDLEPIIFTTDVQLAIPPGSSTGVVAATGDRFTVDANGTAASTVLEYLDSMIEVEFVDLGADITNGIEPETDTDFFARGVTRFSRLTDTLVLPRHFVGLALEQNYIERAVAVDNWDSVSGTPGSDAGHITIAAYGFNRMLTTAEKSTLTSLLDDASLAHLAVHVIDPTIYPVDVTVTVKADEGSSLTEVEADVKQAISDYLSPMAWEWGPVVRYTELVSLISSVPGVDYIISMTPSADITMSGNAPLAATGVIVVTVS